jgi:hypothetical protein
MLLLGSGIMKNEAMVKSMSRSGDHRLHTYICLFQLYNTHFCLENLLLFLSMAYRLLLPCYCSRLWFLLTVFLLNTQGTSQGSTILRYYYNFRHFCIMENISYCYSTYLQLMCWRWYVDISAVVYVDHITNLACTA